MVWAVVKVGCSKGGGGNGGGASDGHQTKSWETDTSNRLGHNLISYQLPTSLALQYSPVTPLSSTTAVMSAPITATTTTHNTGLRSEERRVDTLPVRVYCYTVKYLVYIQYHTIILTRGTNSEPSGMTQ